MRWEHAYQQARRGRAARHFGARPFGLRHRPPDPGFALSGDAGAAGPELLRRSGQPGRRRRARILALRRPGRAAHAGAGLCPAPASTPATMVVQRRLWRRRGQAARSSRPLRPRLRLRPVLRRLWSLSGPATAVLRPALLFALRLLGRALALLLRLERPLLVRLWRVRRPLQSGPQSTPTIDSDLDLDIRRKADNAALFEGHAKARSRTDNLASWCRAWSRRCSPASPASRARRQDHHSARAEDRLRLQAD